MNTASRGLALFVAFSAGVFLAVYAIPAALWPWLGLGLLAPAGYFLLRRVPVGAALCLGAAAGLLWCGAYRAVFFAPAQALDGRQTEVTVCLGESATASDYGAYVSGWMAREGEAPVQVILFGGRELLEGGPGDRATASVRCAQTALREETRFQPQATRGIFLELKADGPVQLQPAQTIPWWCLPRWWGQELARSIRAAFPGETGQLFAGLVTGDKLGLSAVTRTALGRSGVAHMTAVSGMHVSFLVGLLTLLTGYDPRRRALVCIPVVVFFTLAVGATPSVLRACCFQLAVLTAPLLGREIYPWTTLFATLALLLLLDPFSAANLSLQLSFAAVAGIAVVTPRAATGLAKIRFPGEGRRAKWANAVFRFFKDLLAVNLGAIVFTVPLVAYYYGTVSLASPVTNLLVAPAACVAFAAALLTGLLGLVCPAAAAGFGGAVGWLGRYMLWVVRTVAAFPYSAVTFIDLYYPAAIGGIYALVLLVLLWRSQRRRVWVFLSCAGAMVVGSILFTRWTFHTAQLTAAVLDVGQGQSVVLRSGGQTAVVDCGGNGYPDPGGVCADYLNDQGTKRVDKLILTHYHADHVNGLDVLFDRMEVQEVVMPRMERDETSQAHILDLAWAEGAQVTWLDSDTQVTLGQADLTLYAPLGDGGGNEEGASVLVTAGDFHMLLTGDMNASVEARLVNHAHLPRCQVLLVGHHGSRYATGEELLDAIEPENALISVGKNSYGHPARETLSRLEERGIAIYRTDSAGTITLRLP